MFFLIFTSNTNFVAEDYQALTAILKNKIGFNGCLHFNPDHNVIC